MVESRAVYGGRGSDSDHRTRGSKLSGARRRPHAGAVRALILVVIASCASGCSGQPGGADAAPDVADAGCEIREAVSPRRIDDRGWPVVTARQGYLRFAVGGPDGGLAVSVDSDGRRGTTHTYDFEALHWGDLYSIGYVRTGETDGGVVLDLRWADTLIPLTSRWAGCTVSPRDLMLSGDEYFWLVRYGFCTGDPTPRLHVFTIDGAETTPPEGVPFPWPHPREGTEADHAYGVASNNELWLLMDASAPSDPRVGFRAVRYRSDGTVSAASPLLVDPDVLPMLPGESFTPVAGAWIASSTDDAVVVHFASPMSVADPRWVSRFARIEGDGTIAWMHAAPAELLATHGNWELSLDEHEGGIAAVVSEDLTGVFGLLLIAADGSTPLGPGGVPIFDEWLLEPDAEPTRFHRLAVASDPPRGLLIATTEWRGELTSGPALVWHYGVDGRRIAGPFEAIASPFDPDPRLHLFADGDGGAFVVSSNSGGAQYQHLDLQGRPAFGARVRYCGGSWDGSPAQELVYDRP